MSGNEDDELLAAVSALRKSRGWSQLQVGQAIGVSQGHVSKILGKTVIISDRLRIRLVTLIAPPAEDALDLSALEREALAALRASAPFRSLILAALQMHKNE